MNRSQESWSFTLQDEAATERLAGRIAEFLKPGDCLALSGEIGTGKTTLARALIRKLADDSALEVPSPSFSLVQHYGLPVLSVVHADLYRLNESGEVEELGLSELPENGVLVVEWPEKMGQALPPNRLEVLLELKLRHGQQERRATLTGFGSFEPRFRSWKQIGSFLINAGFDDFERIPIQADASGRRYERLLGQGQSVILMIAPPRSDTKPIRAGRSYLQIAHLSETVHAFSAVAKALRQGGFRAPHILAEDLDQGLLIAEDLGNDGIALDGVPIPERYIATAEALADLHAQSWPAEVPIDEGRTHKMQAYDIEAYLIEAELLLDWYVPPGRRGRISGAARARFISCWTGILNEVLRGEKTWTLRDVHSPNVLWQAHAQGNDRVGLIDIQDTLIGHPAYDLASLAQDARLDLPPELEVRILAAYCRRRQFDERARRAFLRAYIILASQRASKILGIFARLDERDNKPHYRQQHTPRIEARLRRNLTHPVMASIQAWMRDALPEFFP